MTQALTIKAPSSDLFAGVQVEASPDGEDWRVVGAAPAFTLDDAKTMVPLGLVTVDCKLNPTDKHGKAGWLHENSQLGVIWTKHPVLTSNTRRW